MADCEAIHDGWLAEPVNAVSSLAYVAAGVWVYRRNRVQGVALIAVGAGSFAYHAFDGGAAAIAHDGSIAVVAALVALAGPRIVRSLRRPQRATWVAPAAFAAALPLQLFGRTGGALCRPDSLWQAHAAWHVLTAVAIAAAFALAHERDAAPIST